MKITIKAFVIVLSLGLLFSTSSCDEVKEILPIPSMTATVDGASWTSLFRMSVLFESNDMITITGTPEANENVDKAIILSIYGTQAGTYELNPGTLTANCLVVYKKTAGAVDGSDNYYISRLASITISSINTEKKLISGTFSATLFPSNDEMGTEIVISNGTFKNLSYQVQP